MSRVLWVNLSGIVSGDGTQDLPFTYGQLKNYFDPDYVDDCYTSPVTGDVLHVYGTVNLIGSDTFININRMVVGSITMKVPNLSTVPWRIETIDNTNTQLYMFKNSPNSFITSLNVSDFVFCQNNVPGGSKATVNLSELTSSYYCNVIFRNFMISAKGDIKVHSNTNMLVETYGYTFIGDVVYILSEAA